MATVPADIIGFLKLQALQQLAGAPDTLLSSQLALALNDFYQYTTAWREVVGPYAVNQNVAQVNLNPTTDAPNTNSQIQFVHQAFLFPFLSGNAPQPLVPALRKIMSTQLSPPSTFWMQAPDQMILWPTPDKNYGNVLFVYASLVPTPACAKLPDISFTHHVDGILAGLYSRMYRMPNKAWTDKQLGMQYEKDYKRAKLVWRDHAERNYGPRDVATIFPPFAGRGSQTLTKAVSG